MKKLLSMILALTMVFSLAACSGGDAKSDEDENDENLEDGIDENSDVGEAHDDPAITVLQCEILTTMPEEGRQHSARIIYDENGNAKTEISYNEDGKETQRIERAYDADGNQILVETYRDGMLRETETTEYDAHGRVVSVTRVSHVDGVEEHQTIRYNEDGTGTNVVEIYANGMMVYKSTITMDEYFNHLSITEEVEGEVYQVEGPYTYEYIEAGNQLTVKRYQDGKCWLSYVETRDEVGRLVSVVTYGGERIIDVYTYRYDENGNQTQETYERYWETGEMDTYESYIRVWTYNEEGRVVRLEDTNYAGYVTYTAEYTYSYVEVPVE